MIKPIAFYLPQFHPVRENSDWWGEGFTEWTNVAKARPNFSGHYQPHIPKDLGFYDLRMTETIAAQAALARQNSIFGFCMYFYWFSGRRILETPIDTLFKSDIDINYCFCWANENWTRRWDGGNNEILLENEHSIGNDNNFIEAALPYMRDDRYIRYDGCPLLLIYRADILANSRETFAHWRKRAIEEGFPGLFIACVNFYGVDRPEDWGGDALVEFPPHQYLKGSFCEPPAKTVSEFKGSILDYRMVLAQSIERRHEDFLMFYGAMPSWDNTPRRQNDPHIFVNASPELFEFWLHYQSVKTLSDSKNKEKFLFINAWNEWAEGAHLEPCLRHGHGFLDAVRRGTNPDKFTAPRPQHDTMLGALASIESYKLDDMRYFVQLEQCYSAALTEIKALRQENQELDLRSKSTRLFLINRLRNSPTLHALARRGYHFARTIGRK
jgi:lipopolysaccharide biosynthesis protein